MALAALCALAIGYRILSEPATTTVVARDSHPNPKSQGVSPVPQWRLGSPPLVECEDGSAGTSPDPAAFARRERASARVLDAIAGELAGHPAAADRALGLFVQLANSGGDVHAEFARQNPQCAQDPSCGPREDAAIAQASRPLLDGITRIALGAKDPGAYQLALTACNSADAASSTGGCTQLSARQWAQLEPDNAQPWLHVASEAARQSQPALVAEALYRASQAPRNDSHWSLFAKLLSAPALQDQGVDVRNDVTFAAMGMTVATQFAPLAPVFSYCSAAALDDANRRQVCDDLARLLTERSDTFVAMATGIKLGERLGWPPARLDALRDWRDAYFQLASERIGADPDSCASLGRQREWALKMMTDGEMNTVRREIGNSGETPAQIARRRHATVHAQSPPAEEAGKGASAGAP